MTTFSRTWNSAYESNPANSQDASLGATRIRELKTDVRERVTVDHYFGNEGGPTSVAGEHRKVTLFDQVSAPSSAASKGVVYALAVAGVVELFYKDSAGQEHQLTNNGLLKLLSTKNSWTAAQTIGETNLGNSGATLNLNYNNGNAQRVTLNSATVTINPPTNPVAGAILTLRLIQDGSGSRATSWSSSFKKGENVLLTPSDGGGENDMAVMYYTGSEWSIISYTTNILSAV